VTPREVESTMTLTVDPHPLINLGAFVTTFPRPLGDGNAAEPIVALLRLDTGAPITADESVRAAVRDMLRHGGYKPTGRGKPSSEYLLRAAGDGSLGSINLAVDACNAVSLHSGLPISVVDLERAAPPFRVGIAAGDASYVFNRAGQIINLGGLVCLFDREGACANPVKDAQRTKTNPGTTRTLSIVWGARALGDRTARTIAWYRELLASVGATTEPL
jgi:DNA/RNA-binding domain of Phe-tRNA-synthetase-like protein